MPKLYGREGELEQLKSAFGASLKDHSQFVIVSGEAGVGKTALVGALQDFVSEEKGYFIQGKFDPYSKGNPYSALFQAFRTLLAQLLSSGEDLTVLQQSLASRLGGNGSLIANMMPQLQELIGIQPPVEPLHLTEETNRFFLSLIQFIEAIASNGKPLVLFLDDLQWADVSTIYTLERLAGNASLKRVLVIGAYRHNAFAAEHPFTRAMEQIKSGSDIRHIAVAPLSAGDAQHVVQDLLGSDAEIARELAGMLYHQTRGNPFFMQEIIKDLNKNRAIYVDVHSGMWRLNTSKISDMTMQDNIVDYLIHKIGRLPESTRRILCLGATIGLRFSWGLLSLLGEKDSKVLAEALIEAIHEDILVPLNPDDYHWLKSAADEQKNDLAAPSDIAFSFQHDKIQQAFYQMVELTARKRLHLQIGRAMLRQLSPSDTEAAIMDIANHLNMGLACILNPAEHDTIIDVHVRAAKQAKAAYGYNTALDLLRVAMSLLTSDAWEVCYERTFCIYKLYCECAYLTHQINAADQACRVLVYRAKSKLELASVYEMQTNYYTYLGMMKESIEAGKRGLKSLGVQVPGRLNKASVMRELLKVKWSLRSKTADDLLRNPPMTDERVRMMMRLLVGFIPPAYISGEQNLFAWAVLKKTHLSAQYGNGPESAGAYIGYAILLSAMGDLQGARDFGQLAVAINENCNDLQWRSLVYVMYTLFCHSWSYSWDTLESWYKKAIEASLMSGDLLYLAHACYYMNLWSPSMEIDSYLQQSTRMIAMIENTKYKEALATARLARQKFLGLSGELENPLSFDDDSFRETEYLRELTEAKYYSGIAIYYIAKIQLSYMYGCYEYALPYIDEAYKTIGTLKGSAFMEEFSLYTFLTLAAAYPQLGFMEKAKARIRMRRELNRMKKWALQCPGNFLQQQYVMQAEFARLFGTDREAEACYNRAIQISGSGNFVRYKALANEQAAKYYESRGLGEMSVFFFRKAAHYYLAWGAKGKVAQLEREYPLQVGGSSRISMFAGRTLSTSVEDMDIHSAIVASQAISQEIGIDSLLDTIIKMIMVNARAQRGCIIVLNAGSALLVEGVYKSDDDEISVRKHDGAEYHTYPKSVIHAVTESKQAIVYQNAAEESEYADDPYLATHKPKSLLCKPLLIQNKVKAIIYLENHLVTGAFTKERLQMIDLLSREFVYSLENASLHTDLEKSEEKYRELINYLMDGIVIIQNQRFVFVNEAMARMVGCEVPAMTDSRLEAFISAKDVPFVKDNHAKLLAHSGESLEYEVRLAHGDEQREVTAIFKATAIQYMNKPAILGAVKDITERKKAEEELRTHRDRLEQLVAERTEELEHKNAELRRYIDIVDKHVMVVQTDPHGVITFVSEEFCITSGYRRDELLGSSHSFLKGPSSPEGPFKDFALSSVSGQTWKGELVQWTKDGSALWLDMVVEPVLSGGEAAGYTFIGHNITDKKRIEQLSITDELTGLYNRRYFNERFRREIKRAARKQSCLTFILLDIDYYKKYNDTYGHYEGDHVLRRIGSSIHGQLKKDTDFAFRLGGEEFGILCPGRTPEESYAFAEQLRHSIEALQIPHEKNSRGGYVTISVGVAAAMPHAQELNNEAIYQLADNALYTSKASGRNCVTLSVL